MQAKDIMTKEVISVKRDTPVDKIIKLLLKHQISGAPVLDEKNKVIGAVSEQDFLYKEKMPLSITSLYLHGHYADPNELALECRKAYATIASQIMSTDPVCVDEDTDVSQIAYLMLEKSIRRVFVLRKGKLVGIVSKADLLKILEPERHELKLKKGVTEAVIKSVEKILAQDIMTRDVITVGHHDLIRDVARIFMDNRITGTPVVDENENVVGVISEGDLLYGKEAIVPVSAYSSGWKECVERFWHTTNVKAEDIMSKKVIAVSEDTPVREVATLLIEKKIKRVPVLKEKKLVGIISRADILQALLMEPEILSQT